jgi:hypothetical protein
MMRFWLVAFGLFLLPTLAPAVEPTAINAAVERGVAALKKMQQADGTWPHAEIGATALAGMTLLECGVSKEDKAVIAAAAAVRKTILTVDQTYSLSLAVMFLDKLDDPNDTPIVESLIIRLLAGQNAQGGWSYTCPQVAAEELKRVTDESSGVRVMRAGGGLGKLPEKGKRTTKDLPKEILAQIEQIRKGGLATGGLVIANGGDNSNTQFATLALWVGRRYGIPTQGALAAVGQRFRTSQASDGSWGYTPGPVEIAGSRPTMTCAGLIGLVCSHGAALDFKKTKDPTAKQDLSKDANLKAGLINLANHVGNPIGWKGTGTVPAGVVAASGKSYYYLWSLERVAVAMNLEKIGDKDWYNWGAELLLANQAVDGSWSGEYASSGADTCFALLFLKKANVTRDLSAGLSGLKGMTIVLRAGGVGAEGLLGSKLDLKGTGIGEKGKSKDMPRLNPVARDPASGRDPETPVKKRTPEQEAAFKVADEVVRSKGRERNAAIDTLRESKGVAYTEALVDLIGRVDGEARADARHALAQRFTRLKDTTLREYLKDEEAEVRRAAALAISARGSRSLVPDLIRLLDDSQPLVQRAAHVALKDLSKKDFGPKADATGSERKSAIASWEKWWKEQSRE